MLRSYEKVGTKSSMSSTLNYPDNDVRLFKACISELYLTRTVGIIQMYFYRVLEMRGESGYGCH